MDYQQIVCKKTGKTMKADNIYKVKNDNCIENIVSICHSCPYSHSNNTACINCYGTIVQSATRQVNAKTGRVKMETENYHNTFLKVGDEYLQMMDADDFLDAMDIVANLNTANWNHGQRISDHLRGYDRPKTWKTDCANCKLKCKNKGVKPACEKAKDFMEQSGINISNSSSEHIAKIELPTDCICQEQAQICYFI